MMTKEHIKNLRKLTYIEPVDWRAMLDVVENLQREVVRLRYSIKQMNEEQMHSGIEKDLNT